MSTAPFVPSANTILSILNSDPALVSTASNHGYSDNLVVRLVLPEQVGMTQLHNKTFQVDVITPNTFTIPVDTTDFDVYNMAFTAQVGQVIPVGEVGDTLDMATDNNNNIVPEY